MPDCYEQIDCLAQNGSYLHIAGRWKWSSGYPGPHLGTGCVAGQCALYRVRRLCSSWWKYYYKYLVSAYAISYTWFTFQLLRAPGRILTWRKCWWWWFCPLRCRPAWDLHFGYLSALKTHDPPQSQLSSYQCTCRSGTAMKNLINWTVFYWIFFIL